MPLNVCRYFQADHFFFSSSHLCLHVSYVQCLLVWSLIRRTTLSLPVLFNVVLVLLPARHSSTNAVMKKLVCSSGQVTRAIPNSNCSIENCDIAAAITNTMGYGRTHGRHHTLRATGARCRVVALSLGEEAAQLDRYGVGVAGVEEHFR